MYVMLLNRVDDGFIMQLILVKGSKKSAPDLKNARNGPK